MIWLVGILILGYVVFAPAIGAITFFALWQRAVRTLCRDDDYAPDDGGEGGQLHDQPTETVGAVPWWEQADAHYPPAHLTRQRLDAREEAVRAQRVAAMRAFAGPADPDATVTMSAAAVPVTDLLAGYASPGRPRHAARR